MKNTGLRIVARDPNKAYVDGMLWLPKARINTRALQGALEFYVAQGNRPVLLKLWDETKHHIITPREFLKPQQYVDFPFPFVRLEPVTFPKTGTISKVVLRDEKQEAASRAMKQARGGILHLAPGKGKTVLACHRIAELGCPALVIVHNTYLMEQWRERIEQFLELPTGEKLGIIQSTEMDWRHPITLAMIHTLALRADEGELPSDFMRHFGVVFFDEVHHLAAPLFVKTAPIVQGLRYGLTATPKRTDGLEFVYNFHIGPVFHEDMEADLVPRVYFQTTPTYIDLSDPTVKDKSGELNTSRLRAVLGEHKEGNLFRAYCIQEALDQGRKILALSHSKAQLRALHDIFPDSGLIIHETPQKERTGIVKNSKLTLAISRLGVEGLDDAALDSLFFLTPFTAENDLQQALGRILRSHGDKCQPVAVVFEDELIPPLRHMCNKLRRTLNGWGIRYQSLPVPKS